MTREIMTKNYMEALLRAALLLGDRHQEAQFREIAISGFRGYGQERQLSPRCRIMLESGHQVPAHGENEGQILILFPEVNDCAS